MPAAVNVVRGGVNLIGCQRGMGKSEKKASRRPRPMAITPSEVSNAPDTASARSKRLRRWGVAVGCSVVGMILPA